MIVAAYQEAITNAASIYPIIGTVGLSPCICLIAYNPETKTAALAHDPLATGIAQAIFNETLSKVRTAPAQLVRIHVIGSFLNSERKGLDTHAKDALEALALEIEQTPNVKLVNV